MVPRAHREGHEHRAFGGGTPLAACGAMSANQNQVVVAYDFSHSARAAFDRAVGLASRAPFHVLHFVCILDPHHALPELPSKHVDLAYADRVREELAGNV